MNIFYDPSITKAWHVDPLKILSKPDWSSLIVPHLGLPTLSIDVEAKLVQLTLYETGGHYTQALSPQTEFGRNCKKYNEIVLVANFPFYNFRNNWNGNPSIASGRRPRRWTLVCAVQRKKENVRNSIKQRTTILSSGILRKLQTINGTHNARMEDSSHFQSCVEKCQHRHTSRYPEFSHGPQRSRRSPLPMDYFSRKKPMFSRERCHGD